MTVASLIFTDTNATDGGMIRVETSTNMSVSSLVTTRNYLTGNKIEIEFGIVNASVIKNRRIKYKFRYNYYNCIFTQDIFNFESQSVHIVTISVTQCSITSDGNRIIHIQSSVVVFNNTFLTYNNGNGSRIISSTSNGNFTTFNLVFSHNNLPNGIFYQSDSSNNILILDTNDTSVFTSANDIFESIFSIGTDESIIKNYQFYNLVTENDFTFSETSINSIFTNVSINSLSCNISQFLFYGYDIVFD